MWLEKHTRQQNFPTDRSRCVMPGGGSITTKAWMKEALQLASALQKFRKSGRGQADSCTISETPLGLQSPGQPGCLRSLLLEPGKQPWNNDNNKQLKTQADIWSCETNSRVMGAWWPLWSSNSSQSFWLAGRLSIPELGQVPGSRGVAQSNPKRLDPGGRRCSV